MEFTDVELQQYVEQHTKAESEVLKKLNRETHANVLRPRMLSGHLQGRVLSMLSHMIKPKCILEIGTYTGYSAICLSEGLTTGGKLITIDVNEELEEMVRGYFEEAGLTSSIEYIIGNAVEVVPTLDIQPDIVFIDADKASYSAYFDMVIDKMASGGFIIADNVLWSGKVVGDKIDKKTQVIMDFNEKVHNDERVENVLFPIRDGLMVMRKI
ncbi:O-methyltransferase [Fulvivirga maritima]|uniref:O-methyltransferase n=1 Tax=Fulvivirga maritima TaxID=2904247 RepID=UPI001F24418F|nr:O-methyltransferase [Fulvivirga maritima]UII29049.1 O-methyltransferase [Fulvivirga maritima]